MRRLTLNLLLITLAVCLFALAASKASAGYDAIQQDVVVPSGAASVTTTITMQASRITDVIVDAPTIDAGDGTSITLRVAFAPVSGTAKQTYTPRTWADVGLSSTGDGAVVKCVATAMDVHVDSYLVLGIVTTTNQAAARTFRFRIQREY